LLAFIARENRWSRCDKEQLAQTRLPNRQPRRTLHADETSREIAKKTALTTK
jgi:hypothetical protein